MGGEYGDYMERLADEYYDNTPPKNSILVDGEWVPEEESEMDDDSWDT